MLPYLSYSEETKKIETNGFYYGLGVRYDGHEDFKDSIYPLQDPDKGHEKVDIGNAKDDISVKCTQNGLTEITF